MPKPSGSSMSEVLSWLEELPVRHLRPLPHRSQKRKRMSSTPSKRPSSPGSGGPAPGGPTKRLRQSPALSSGASRPSSHPLSQAPSLLPPLEWWFLATSPKPDKRRSRPGAVCLPPCQVPASASDPYSSQPIRSLDATIAKISKGVGIYPLSLKDDIIAAKHTLTISRNEALRTMAVPCETRFARLQQIMAATEWSIRWKRSEAAWNNYVHTPMLETALADVEFVHAELITTAPILPPFLPKVQLGPALVEAVSQAKMVDYALVLQPMTDPSDRRPTAYQTLLRTLPIGQYTLN
ncbi:hypothetical protein B0T25DRAFT_247833 [Lasiosphaeria hispida]|uniref:PD-(D/E)XK nuclease-like domain-containing protein n=1 Tax=Lasiosphaeria hispida TaxID=260671 RepID=A0AAJ0MCN1_9PEZI|nr:hypothetical protein B0T25DRAFT_247833 [Lasiosphaeria hispida]